MKKSLFSHYYSKGEKVFAVFNYIFLTLLTLVYIFPLVNILSSSFSDSLSVQAGEVLLWPVNLTLRSYEYVIHQGAFFTAFLVSVERVLVGVSLNMLLSIFIAYPISRPDRSFKARKWYMLFFVITMLFYGGMIPSYLVVRFTGIRDTIWALVLPGAIQAFYVIILTNFFREIPKEIEESAIIDGAGHFTVLFRIYLPLSKAALATLMLFFFVNHWNSWFDGLIYMNKAANYPLQSYLQTRLQMPDLRSVSAQDFIQLMKINQKTIKAAEVFISILPIMAIYPFVQKYFTKGVVLGSVKG